MTEHKKKPLVSCEKFDEENKKALLEEEAKKEKAKVEPKHPPEQKGGTKKGIMGGCKR